MTGERLSWFRLASHLHSPIQYVKRTTSSLEFTDWIVYLNEEPNRFNALYMYIAQLTAEVRRSWIKQSEIRKTKASDFVIKFVDEKTLVKQKLEQKTEASKSRWLGFLGIKRK